jgi:Cu/Ag efflux protein CusF
MRRTTSGLGIVLAAALAVPAVAQPAGVEVAGSAPGYVEMAKTVNATGSIAAIDKATREVTLKGDGGKELTVTAGPAVKNFDKLKVGDRVELQIVRSLALELKKGSTAVVARDETMEAVGAAPGENPHGAIGRQVTVTAEIIALDAENRVVTLEGPKHTVELEIADPAQFESMAVGDRIEATYTEAVAVAVTPAGSAP